MRFINLTCKIVRWTCSSVRGSNEPSKPFRIKKIHSHLIKVINCIIFILCLPLDKRYYCVKENLQLIDNKSYFLLAHLAFRPCECHHFSSVVRPSTFHILIFSSETTGPIAAKLWWNGPWMAPFQNCVRWSRLPSKMATKLKIEKRGDEILNVHCCFSISQKELKF